jgi:hypothetical protein
MWKGPSPGSARRWISRHKPKPASGLCEGCNKRQYRYLVNVTRKYTRDFANWEIPLSVLSV